MTASAPARPRILADDQILDARYRILGLLAEGGMGAVFHAEHVLIKRRVAIKVLHREFAHDTAMVERFMNEALAAGTLGHPNIVEATDMGFTPDRVPYIVYEYLEGSLLTEEVYRIGGLPLRRALRIAIQIASALEAAHNAGIVHLDLKSDNVFLTDKDGALDHVKVLDFGISRFMTADTEKTQRGLVMGTPEFMAPEQVTSPDAVDKRADIYALGVLLYEMLGARRPYAGDDPRVLLYRICNEPLPPLDQKLSPELEHVLFERMLAKDREQRFASMKEVIAALDGETQTVRAADSLATRASADALALDVADESPRRTRGAVLGIALLAAVAGGGLMFAADRIASSTTEAAGAVLEADAEQIAAVLASQARSARKRVDGLASSPILREAIETDTATISEVVRDGSLFMPYRGEVLELFLLGQGKQTSVLRLPANERPIRLATGTRIESRADGLWVVAYAPVPTQLRGSGGTLAIASRIDVEVLRRKISEDAVEASLRGLGAPMELATSNGDKGGTLNKTIPVATPSELGDVKPMLHAKIRPVARDGMFRVAGYAAFGAAGLLLLGSLAGRLRRRVPVIKEP